MALICYDCGAENEEDALLCFDCHGTVLTFNQARPVNASAVVRRSDWLPEPWDMLVHWPEKSVVALDGGPGAGKSSLCSLLRPDNWITSEETVGQATDTLRRLQNAEGEGWPGAPNIIAVAGLYGALDALLECYSGMLVCDSATALGSPAAQLEFMEAVIDWARAEPHRRAVVILGHTQAGGAAGPRKIAHLAQTEASVSADAEGRRRIGLRKHRHGALTSRYFKLGAHGVEVPDFPYAYSVEGPPGGYELVVYPSKGTEWAGRFEAIEDNDNTLQLRCASASKRAPYGRGYIEPGDAQARRDFAAVHGLAWVDHKGRHEVAKRRDHG